MKILIVSITTDADLYVSFEENKDQESKVCTNSYMLYE